MDSPQPTTDLPPVPVLFIGGNGRSGSTLVERLLDQIPGFVAVGETCHLVQRGLIEDMLCGCGETFGSCEMWQAVGKELYGGWDQIDPEELHRLQMIGERTRYVPRNLLVRSLGRASEDQQRWFDHLGRFYRAIADVTGADVIIDSSKHLSTASAIANVPSVDLRALHLIRDSRGVARAWTKQVVRPEITGTTAYMPQYHPILPAWRWMTDNTGFEILDGVGVDRLRMRYEDILADPIPSLREIVRFARPGNPEADLSFITDRVVDLAEPSHSVAGNPMRFTHGEITLRTDEEWKTALSPAHKALVTTVTAPLLARYNYLERGR